MIVYTCYVICIFNRLLLGIYFNIPGISLLGYKIILHIFDRVPFSIHIWNISNRESAKNHLYATRYKSHLAKATKQVEHIVFSIQNIFPLVLYYDIRSCTEYRATFTLEAPVGDVDRQVRSCRITRGTTKELRVNTSVVYGVHYRCCNTCTWNLHTTNTNMCSTGCYTCSVPNVQLIV